MWVDVVGITLTGLIAIILVTTLEWASIDPCDNSVIKHNSRFDKTDEDILQEHYNYIDRRWKAHVKWYMFWSLRVPLTMTITIPDKYHKGRKTYQIKEYSVTVMERNQYNVYKESLNQLQCQKKGSK